jgi:NTE family protein
MGWQIVGPPGREGLLVGASEKPYAPPFLMIGLNLENTTSDDFRVQLAGRYLAFDVAGSGSELRIDGTIGSDPSAGVALYRPILGSHLFVRPYAFVEQRVSNFVSDDIIVAEYRERRAFVGGDIGVTIGRVNEISAGFRAGRLSATVQAGDPNLPELAGLETSFRTRWLFDDQDSPVLPSRGVRVAVAATHVFKAPEAEGIERSNDGLTQMEGGGSSVWSLSRRNRLFVVAAGGTSFDHQPLSTAQFTVGFPFRLDAFTVGDHRGDHYAVVTAGLMRQFGRLPDFLGGPIFAGLWLENGSVFDEASDADFNTHAGIGVVMDTLVGPVLVGSGVGLDGGWRAFVGVGRLFR